MNSFLDFPVCVPGFIHSYVLNHWFAIKLPFVSTSAAGGGDKGSPEETDVSRL